MSKPLDGLREELRDNSYQLRPGERHIELPDALAIIDQFEAEHPGLVDCSITSCAEHKRATKDADQKAADAWFGGEPF